MCGLKKSASTHVGDCYSSSHVLFPALICKIKSSIEWKSNKYNCCCSIFVPFIFVCRRVEFEKYNSSISLKPDSFADSSANESITRQFKLYPSYGIQAVLFSSFRHVSAKMLFSIFYQYIFNITPG